MQRIGATEGSITERTEERSQRGMRGDDDRQTYHVKDMQIKAALQSRADSPSAESHQLEKYRDSRIWIDVRYITQVHTRFELNRW